MTSLFSRRDFPKSADGMTALTLTPLGDGVFAAPPATGPRLPLFTVIPYIQPGAISRLIEGAESVVVA
jgi:hypothetical protein